jgi:SSS family solute:Na+ symporter
MGQAFIIASFSWISNFFSTIIISLMTRPKTDEELKGLVYSLTEKVYSTEKRWYMKVAPLSILLLIITIILNIIFF